MAKWHLKSHRKPTGGALNISRKKRRSDRGYKFLETKVGPSASKVKKGKAGIRKIRVASSDTINVADKKGKITKTKILTVVENPANPNYVRRNVMTKGCIVKTEMGLAKITSRPSQHGIVNGILIEEKKA